MTDESKMFTRISKSDLREILEAAHCYWALEAGGVDNWEWFSDSLESYLEDFNTGASESEVVEDIEELAESILDNCEWSVK